MIIKKKLFASQQGMALLQENKPREIGGITEPMDLELQNGELTKVYCVFFNLDTKLESTDFFLFSIESNELITHSIGRKTDSFFRKLYKKAIGDPDATTMDSFLDEFIGEYILEGLMGSFP